MSTSLKDLLIGPPLPTHQLAEKRLNKIRALAAFSPDALSSIAYANEEIFLGLVIAGSAGLTLAWPIGLAIVGLLIIVALSYSQTIHGYPSGGGSWIVARANLGTVPGLVAGAALLIDYLLTAAVSLTAGVAAIASAFPVLWPYRVELALVLLGVITLINLRGLKETGTLMAIPVYLFLFTYLPMLAYGAVRAVLDGPGSLAANAPPAAQPLTTFIVLHAFAAGCTALTGIEAISNGVPAFQPPESRNARRTLLVMAVLMGVLFVGSIGLTQYLAVVAGPQETILSALARRLLGNGPVYLLIQASTMLILAVAANTSFADFPRVTALLAKDGFLPSPLFNLGDRLVFANGIIVLAVATGALIVVFGGDAHALVPLFAIGAFLAFTLSQAGMVVHWWRERGSGWWLKAAINGIGSLATGAAVLIIGVSKFAEGAWITILVIPAMVAGLSQDSGPLSRGRPATFAARAATQPQTVSAAASGRPHLRRPSRDGGCHHLCPLHRQGSDGGVHRIGAGRRAAYPRRILPMWWPDVPLVILPSPYRSIVGPLLDFLDETDRQHNDGQLAAVVLPEFVPAKWWQSLLHNQTAWLIKAALLYNRRRFGFQRVIIDVPHYLRR